MTTCMYVNVVHVYVAYISYMHVYVFKNNMWTYMMHISKHRESSSLNHLINRGPTPALTDTKTPHRALEKGLEDDASSRRSPWALSPAERQQLAMAFWIPLFIWYTSWTPHFVEYKSKTRAKMAESHTTKSKPWPQWGRYTHYNMGPKPCIWLLFLDPFGPNSWILRGLRKLKSGFFLDLHTVLS